MSNYKTRNRKPSKYTRTSNDPLPIIPTISNTRNHPYSPPRDVICRLSNVAEARKSRLSSESHGISVPTTHPYSSISPLTPMLVPSNERVSHLSCSQFSDGSTSSQPATPYSLSSFSIPSFPLQIPQPETRTTQASSISIPDTPTTLLNESFSSNSLLSSPFSILQTSKVSKTAVDYVPGRLRRAHITEFECLVEKLQLVDKYVQQISVDFDSLGDFLQYLFYSRKSKKSEDPRQPKHKLCVSRFLQGRNKVKPLDIVKRMYQHRNSYPSYRFPADQKKAFSLKHDPSTVSFARPAISCWAAHLCAARAHRDISVLTKDDPEHPEDAPSQMTAQDVSWEDINEFSPERSVATFQRRTPFLYGFFEYLALPRRNGVAIERKTRPVEIVTINFVMDTFLSRSQYISFRHKLTLTKKRLMSRLGLVTSDSTTRRVIRSMTDNDMGRMQHMTNEETKKKVVGKCYVLDNVQRQDNVWEGGALKASTLRCGTAATKIDLEDVRDGAFDLSDHLSRIALNLRSGLTIYDLFYSIKWSHHHSSLKHYVVKTLVNSYNSLSSLNPLISEHFRTTLAIHRLPANRNTKIQPLEDLVEWVGGDGASFAAILRCQKYLPQPHLAIAQNHFGPSTCADPSSLSKLYTVAGFKRPANLKHCDHYPTSSALELIWISQVLDCWRIRLGVQDLESHFDELAKANSLPTLEYLLEAADSLIQCYISISGYQRVISLEARNEVKQDKMRVNPGSEWVSSQIAQPLKEQVDDKGISCDIVGFDGDRTLANSILFKLQFGSYLLLEYAIKDGDVGRVLEQLKIWIFLFSGSSHQIYASYLLELNCLLEFETSPSLRSAILNNYLVKFGLKGKFQERDIMQEHQNLKLQNMVDRSHQEFDGSFYRGIIAPNVDNFTKIGRKLEDAFRHITVDLFSVGYDKLGAGGKLKEFIKKTTSRAKFIAAIEKEKKHLQDMNIDNASTTMDIPIDQSPLKFLIDPETDEYDSTSSESEEEGMNSEVEMHLETRCHQEESDGEVEELGDVITDSDDNEDNWSD
ncbi:hypothetical protein K435DRAFT_867989 [Dendrothele bispora CBS 962.96]|uniref:DUF6589 domain-containing protein n=1 Tax=Dendrothele bispora (strain CBS 962.96) TaxID=1314807 RepID=A0A4V4HDC6_DENBC|nr:hypothetical protein K435DRAFT_867989 [Dendrothele bispora CBS 962.96]